MRKRILWSFSGTGTATAAFPIFLFTEFWRVHTRRSIEKYKLKIFRRTRRRGVFVVCPSAKCMATWTTARRRRRRQAKCREFRWSGSKSLRGAHTHTLRLHIEMEFIANSTFKMAETAPNSKSCRRKFTKRRFTCNRRTSCNVRVRLNACERRLRLPVFHVMRNALSIRAIRSVFAWRQSCAHKFRCTIHFSIAHVTPNHYMQFSLL